MKRYVGEFKDFINKGDVITIAVGLVMALYFQKIVTAVLDGVINPIIAAIFGESNFADIGFDISDAVHLDRARDRRRHQFIVVAFFLFLVIKAYNNFKAKQPVEDDRADRDPAPGRDPRRAAGRSPAPADRRRAGAGRRVPTATERVQCPDVTGEPHSPRSSRSERSASPACASGEAASPPSAVADRGATSAALPGRSTRRDHGGIDRRRRTDHRRRRRRRRTTTTDDRRARRRRHPARRAPRRRQPPARDRRLDPGLDRDPLRRRHVRPARAAWAGRSRSTPRRAAASGSASEVLERRLAAGWDAAVDHARQQLRRRRRRRSPTARGHARRARAAARRAAVT